MFRAKDQNKQETSSLPISAGLLIDLFFDPEEEYRIDVGNYFSCQDLLPDLQATHLYRCKIVNVQFMFPTFTKNKLKTHSLMKLSPS
jgi:hypothetical protein